MKHLILITLLLTQTLFAADKAASKNEVKGGIVINDSLQKLMDIEGVKPLYENCSKTKTGAQDILSCLWENVSKNEDLKKKVQTAYQQQLKPKEDEGPATGASRKPASEAKTNLTGRVNASSVDYGSDPAVQQLSDYYGKKLAEILSPDKVLTKEERDKGLIVATDHKKFIDLYKSELGKSIISAFTSYCMDVTPSSCQCDKAEILACKNTKNPASCCSKTDCTISDDVNEREEARKQNVSMLASADLSSDGPDSVKWRMCITSATNACKNKSSSATTETTNRSCILMDYVESARKNIMVADKQIDYYEKLDKGVQVAGIGKTNEDSEKSSSDAILKISSADVKEALKGKQASEIEEFKKCYNEGQVVNEKECEKYLSVDVDKNNAAIAELGIRQYAQEDTLNKELKDDKNVAAYLKEEGFSEKDIEKMTDKATIEDTRKEILARYSNQKKAIIAEMASKIESKTATTNGKIEIANDKNKLEKIKEEIANRSKDLEGLVKFNNIVSSYLEVKQGNSKKTERNTASLYGEVDGMTGAEKAAAQQKISDAKLTRKKSSDAQSQTNLDVSTINEDFLNYNVLDKDKKD